MLINHPSPISPFKSASRKILNAFKAETSVTQSAFTPYIDDIYCCVYIDGIYWHMTLSG